MEWRFLLYHSVLGNISGFEEPLGWDSITKTIRRDMETAGAVFAFSAELKFMCVAYDFIRTAYDLDGIESEVHFTAFYRCQPEAAEVAAFYGRLNFGTLKFDATVRGASCNIEALDPLIELESRKDLSVDLLKLTSVAGKPLAPYAYAPYDLTLFAKAVFKRVIYQKADFSEIAISSFIQHGSTHRHWQSIVCEDHGVPSDITGTRQHVTSHFWITPFWDQEIVNETGVYNGSLPQTANTFSSSPIGPIYTVAEAGLYRLKTCFCYEFGAGQHVSGTAAYVPNTEGTVTVFIQMGTNPPVAIDTQFIICDESANPYSGCYGVTGYGYQRCVTIDTGFVPLNALDDIKLYIYCEFGVHYDPSLITDNTANSCFGLSVLDNSDLCCLEITSVIKAQESTAKVMLANEALARLVEHITDNKLTVLSDYLGRPDSEPYAAPSGAMGCGALTAMTNGFALRRFDATLIAGNAGTCGLPPTSPTPINGKEMFTSFADMFGSLSAVYGLGYGVQFSALVNRYVLRIEPISFFYPKTVVLSILNINHRAAKWIREIAQDLYVSVFNVGYEKWETESDAGLDEFATKRQYVNPHLTKTANVVDKISKYIASGYAIEITRKKSFDAKPTADWRYDNDMFFIRVTGDTWVGPNAVSYPRYKANDLGIVTGTASNLLDPGSVLNWPLAPYYAALKWASIWGMSIRDYPGASPFVTMKFASADGNFKARGESANAWNFCDPYNRPFLHRENDSLLNTEAAPPILRPETVTFEHPVALSDWEAIEANPEGMVQCMNEYGVMENFFIKEATYDYRKFRATFNLISAR